MALVGSRRVALLGARRVAASTTATALLTSLIAFWKLDEASGDALDSVGANTLTDGNTVTSAVGKVGNARQFTRASSENLGIADNASLSTGDIDYTWAGWVYLDSKPAGTMTILEKGNSGGPASDEYHLHWLNTNDRLQFIQRGTGTITVVANNLGAPSLATWYFVVAWHDAAANTINIQVNDGTVDSQATAGAAPSDAGQSMHIGSRSGGVGNHWDGRVDAVGFWKRVLTADERTYLYNAGNGREHPFT